MRNGVKKVIKSWLPQLLALGLLLGCAVGNPNPSAPSPPLEIPALLTFPEDVGVDLGSAPAGDESLFKAIKLGVMEAATLSQIIAIGPDEIQITNDDLLASFLSPISQFEIPVSPDVKTFEGNITEESFGFIDSRDYKIDFSAFDYDGDGIDEPCTGSTCPVAGATGSCPKEVAEEEELAPVCFRVWVRRNTVPEPIFVRVLAGYFDILPVKDDMDTPENEENPGKGNFKTGLIETFEEGPDSGTFRLLLGVIYDHRQPDSPFNQMTEVFGITDSVFNGELLQNFNLHNLVTQTENTDPGGANFIKKEVKSTSLNEGQTDFEVLGRAGRNYIGFFRDDQDFWSGSFYQFENEFSQTLPTTCARISAGEEVSQEICEDLFIDSRGQAFLPLAKESQVEFPADFPETPTFPPEMN